MKSTLAVLLLTLPFVASAANTTSTEDAQSSLTLDPRVLATGFFQDGSGNGSTSGQTLSATSQNNFINFCTTVPDKPITNGQQIKSGSCNTAPMGIIAAATNMPSAKFVFPLNFDTSLQPNTPFTIKLALSHLHAGAFTNAQTTFFAAPQTVDPVGDIVGHTHIVIEALEALNQTKPTDPSRFAFFKGVDAPQDADGNVSVDVSAGLPAGFYRMATINSAANHQPVLVGIAQHGALDDQIYFTVGIGGSDADSEDSTAQAAASSLAATAAASTPSGVAPTASLDAASSIASASAATPSASGGFVLQNGQAALALNAQFASAKSGDSCTSESVSCAGDLFAQCVRDALLTLDCGPGTVCRALPLVNGPGTSVACTTAADADARIKATGATTRRRRGFSVRRRV